MRIIAAIAVTGLVAAIAQHASAGMREDCVQSDDQDLQIGGCTAVIRSGEWQGKNLAWAYNNRGAAYDDLGEYRRAVEDYDQALRLDPNVAKARANRGNAYNSLAWGLYLEGRNAEALAAFERAMQISGADGVRRYQEALAGHGYYQGAIDGAYGANTRAALTACLDAGCRVLE